MSLSSESIAAIGKCTNDELLHGLIIATGNAYFVSQSEGKSKSADRYTEEQEAYKNEVIQRLKIKGQLIPENLKLIENLILAKISRSKLIANECGSHNDKTNNLVEEYLGSLRLILDS